MIEITINSDHECLLLSEMNKLTPKIPLRKKLFISVSTQGVQTMSMTYQIDGLSGEDEVYYILKYNGTYTPK